VSYWQAGWWRGDTNVGRLSREVARFRLKKNGKDMLSPKFLCCSVHEKVERHVNTAEGATMKMEISVSAFAALLIAASSFLELAYAQSTPEGS
jgi:hypothetical protein